MGFIDRVRDLFSGNNIRQSVGYTGTKNFWMNLGLGRETNSGQQIGPNNAMQLSVVYSCINKIASTVAMLPVNAHRNEGGFERVDNISNYLLNVSPDNKGTANEFKQSLIAMSYLYGVGYARIIRDKRTGDVLSLELLHSNKVKPGEIEGAEVYQIGEDEYIMPDDLIIVPAILRKSPIELNAESLGLFKAAQYYAAKFFDGGGVMNGLLTSDEPLEAEQINTLLDTWERQAGKQTRMMPFGMKYHRFGVEPDKAQNTDARKHEAEEICRIFNIPPAMVGLGSSSYGDYENQARAFVNQCIAPIAAKLENEYNLKLLNRTDRASVGFRHDLDELMRGDMTARSAFYDKMLINGVMNRNEVRAKERMNAIQGGDVHTVQVNQIALTELEAYSKKISDGGI